MVADCAHSVSDDWYSALREAGLPHVVALCPHRGSWVRADQPHTPIDASRTLAGTDPDQVPREVRVKVEDRDGSVRAHGFADAMDIRTADGSVHLELSAVPDLVVTAKSQ